MTNVIQFPFKAKMSLTIAKATVFYIGLGHVPHVLSDVQQLYLKRQGVVDGKRRWAVITYDKFDQSDKRTYSIELETSGK